MIKPSQPGFRPSENHTTALRARKCIPPLVAGATTFPPLVSVKLSSVIHLTVDDYYLCGFGLISISV